MVWRHRLFRGGLLLLVSIGLPVLFLGALAKKEQDDRFCIACHLHEEKFTRFRAPTASDLAGAHHHVTSPLRCIGCHGGADLSMRLRVWTVAGLDTVRFFVAREPDRMRLPLRDRECKQCHDPILPMRTVEQEEAAEGRGDSYHEINDHRTVKIPCVTCHSSHTIGEARFQFVDRNRIGPICRECHKELSAGNSLSR